MRMGLKYYCLGLLLTCWCSAAISQSEFPSPEVISTDSLTRVHSSTPFIVSEIIITGNRKTKSFVIERELPFKRGDSIHLPELVRGFEIARQQLMNTTLFNDVVVALKSFRGYYVDILIDVKERWYIFPVPYVKPVDRNIAEFIKQGLGVDRLNYGFKFIHRNFSGRNDKLRIWLITGYTRQAQLLYEQPYADQSLKHGYRFGFLYSSNKEINYATVNNEQKFTDSLSGSKRWYAHVDYTYRPGLRTINNFRIAIVHQQIDSQVFSINPKYFNTAATKLTYPEISYTLNYYNVDYIPYPLSGWMGELSLLKQGLGGPMNMWQLSGKITKSWEVAEKMYLGSQTYGVLRVPFKQPFINQRLFGYGELYLRGLENYVVDGVAAALTRQTLRRELIRFNVPTHLKSRTHDIIPFRIYAKTYVDIGYAHNPIVPQNSLTNRMLYTAGAGIDIVTFYDFVFRLDYSFNQLGQNGLFLHIKNDF